MFKTRALFNSFWQKMTIACLLLGFGTACQSQEYTCGDNDTQEIQASIIEYIENDSKGASQGASIASEKCLSGYASAVVHYNRPDFDDQIAYLQKVKNQWVILGLATGFDDELMSKIPEAIQQ